MVVMAIATLGEIMDMEVEQEAGPAAVAETNAEGVVCKQQETVKSGPMGHSGNSPCEGNLNVETTAIAKQPNPDNHLKSTENEAVSKPSKAPPSPRFPILSFSSELSYADLLESCASSTPQPTPLPKPHSSLLKDAMSRLDNHGLMANPLDIGRHYSNKEEAELANEDYYNLDDDFIDDSGVQVEDMSDEEWKRTLAEGAYWLPAKEFRPEQAKKRPRTRQDKRNTAESTVLLSENISRVLVDVRGLYPKDKRNKIQSGLKSALVKLSKEVSSASSNREALEARVKHSLKNITRLPTDTISVSTKQQLYSDATKKAVVTQSRLAYFHSLQGLKSALLRLCKDDNPVLTADISKLYAKCLKLLETALALAKSAKGVRSFDENEQRKRLSEAIKEGSFSKFSEQDLAKLVV